MNKSHLLNQPSLELGKHVQQQNYEMRSALWVSQKTATKSISSLLLKWINNRHKLSHFRASLHPFCGQRHSLLGEGEVKSQLHPVCDCKLPSSLWQSSLPRWREWKFQLLHLVCPWLESELSGSVSPKRGDRAIGACAVCTMETQIIISLCPPIN